MKYMILSEATLPRFLWRILMRRPTCIIGTMSQFRGAATGHLDWLVAKFRDCVTVLGEDHLDWLTYPFFGDMIRDTNIFAEMEPWMEERLAFDRSDERLGAYAVAYRHACSNVAFRRYEMGYRIKDVLDHGGDSPIYGIDAFDIAFYLEHFGELPSRLRRRFSLGLLTNSMLTLASLAYSLVWIASRMRLTLPSPETYRLGCDFMEHATNVYLWDEISDRPDDVLVVFRSKAEQKAYNGPLHGRPAVASTDGLFSLKGGIAAMAATVTDSLKILRHGGALPTDFFRQLIALPFRRMMYRGLLNRYHCLYFWGRDDYNSEHALRTVEVRRAGGISLGMMHGIPSIAAIVHQLRHIDFDIYYVHGRYQYERYYREKWPKKMLVRAIGSFGLSRQDFHRQANITKGNGVACFLSRTFQADETFAALADAARAFPDRTFYVNIKPKELDVPVYGPKLRNFLATAPKNVIYHTGRSYELFFSCRTVLSEGSTLAAEAIQFGLESYIFDFAPNRWKVMDYREFPAVCVDSSTEVIEHMQAVEAGTWSFPRQAFASFIELNGRLPWDVIREDMGQPAIDTTPAKDTDDNAEPILNKA